MNALEDTLSRGLPGAALRLTRRSRVLTAAAWRGLRLWQDLTGSAPNLVDQLRRIGAAPAAPGGLRVLVLSMRGWTTHLAWETTLARALQQRGCSTYTVLCGRSLPACEPRTINNDFASTCDRCVAQGRRVLEATGLPWGWLHAELATDAGARAAGRVAGLGLEELRAFVDDGVPVGQLVEASVNRHLLGSSGLPEAKMVEVWRRFVAAGILARQAGERLLGRLAPERILMLNGLFSAEAVVLHLARERGIPVWAYERGKKLDSLIFSRDEAVVRQSYEGAWHRRRDVPLDAEQEQRLDAYLDARLAGNVGIERLWPEQHGADTLVDADAPTAVLFTNVLWDTAMYDSDVAFSSMVAWVVHTVRRFAATPERRLVVRVHPAEVRVPFKESRVGVAERVRAELGTLPPNVRIIDAHEAVDSYALVRSARVVLAYASTIGLESVLLGRPTVVAGRTHYRGRGFTLDATTPDDFDEALERAFEIGEPDDAARTAARLYAYMYFFEEIISFPLVHEEPRSYATLGYESDAELAPGRDAALDAVCTAIIDGTQLVNPGA